MSEQKDFLIENVDSALIVQTNRQTMIDANQEPEDENAKVGKALSNLYDSIA